MSKNTIVILAAIAALASLLAAVLWRGPPSNPRPEEGQAIAQAFLDRLGAVDAAAAWDSTTAEFKSAEGKPKFAARVNQNAWLREPMTFSSVQQVKVNDSERLEFAFTSSKSGKFVRILLARDQGEWKVDRLSF